MHWRDFLLPPRTHPKCHRQLYIAFRADHAGDVRQILWGIPLQQLSISSRLSMPSRCDILLAVDSSEANRSVYEMNHKLLIAESDVDLCDIYSDYLRRQGFEVDVATSGVNCLAKLQRSTPALLVLNLELLWGGGDGVLACLREAGVFTFPVILTSPYAIRNVAPPLVRVVRKPFKLVDLLDAIGEQFHELPFVSSGAGRKPRPAPPFARRRLVAGNPRPFD